MSCIRCPGLRSSACGNESERSETGSLRAYGEGLGEQASEPVYHAHVEGNCLVCACARGACGMGHTGGELGLGVRACVLPSLRTSKTALSGATGLGGSAISCERHVTIPACVTVRRCGRAGERTTVRPAMEWRFEATHLVVTQGFHVADIVVPKALATAWQGGAIRHCFCVCAPFAQSLGI